MKIALHHRIAGSFLAVLLVAIGVRSWLQRKPAGLDFASVTLYSGTTGVAERPACFGKLKCLVIVSAPWCPHCAESRPVTTQLLREYGRGGDKGFLLVSQADTLEKIKAEAAGYGEGAYYDPTDRFATLVGATSLPTWLLFDDKGNILSRSTGAYRSTRSLVGDMGF